MWNHCQSQDLEGKNGISLHSAHSFTSKGEPEQPEEVPTTADKPKETPKEVTAPELVKQFSEESTHSVPVESEPVELTGEEITKETTIIEPIVKQEYKAHEQKVSLALEAVGEDLPLDVSEAIVPGEITMEISER